MSFRMAVVVLSLFLLVGCQKPKMPGFIAKWTGDDTETSIDGSAPARRSVAADTPSDIFMDQAADQATEIQLAEYSSDSDPVELYGATVVAEVNSLPIFADDVLQPHSQNLKKAEEQLSTAEMNRLREKLIKQDLPQHIEKTLLISALRDSIEEEQFERLTTQVDSLFLNEIDNLKKRYKVGTKIELERILQQQGTSLDGLSTSFQSRELAMFYIGQQSRTNLRFSRLDLMDWYEQNKAQYEIDAAVKWQQIRINITAVGGRPAAFDRMKQAIESLRGGTDFSDAARKFSDGPKRASGGIWDWTKQGSLAADMIDRALFEIPVGKISQPLETPKAYVLVKVIERRDAGYVPFEDVQDTINAKLMSDGRRNAAEKVIRDLNNAATIRTIFDSTSSASSPPTQF